MVLNSWPRSCRPSHAGKTLFIGSGDADTVSASPEPIKWVLPAWEGRQLRGKVLDLARKCFVDFNFNDTCFTHNFSVCHSFYNIFSALERPDQACLFAPKINKIYLRCKKLYTIEKNMPLLPWDKLIEYALRTKSTPRASSWPCRTENALPREVGRFETMHTAGSDVDENST